MREAEMLAASGRHAEAVSHYRRLVLESPASVELQVRYGHALRAMGQRDACVAAYRQAIAISPERGDAYWSLASLPWFQFSEADVASMEGQLARADLAAETRAYFHSALGAAYGASAEWERSFDNYARANAIRRLGVSYDPDWTSRQVAQLKALLTLEFLRDRADRGCDSRAPIFIVGMQRSGSTLIEQILASHSTIEAFGELPDMPRLADGLDCRAAEWRGLGQRYLECTRDRRALDRPFFIDKQPYNFWHVGWIHLMLPYARIIDVRRHPLGCCFSNFTKISKHALPFFHRQSDLGCYYADYVTLMTHFDRVLPGRVYRVIYEKLVADLEGEVRRLLEHLGLGFEERCLRFHENSRAFDSASNEQVRMPLFSDGVDHWRNYEPWLGPFKKALGPVLESYAGAPQFGP